MRYCEWGVNYSTSISVTHFNTTGLIHCSVPSVLAAPPLVMVSQYAGNAVASTEAQDG